jgi:HAD superfamily hydrolase (TIGR01484 family)
MGKAYSEEIIGLAGTLSWAAAGSIERLVAALSPSFGRPLVAVGSGGSLTACHFMAMLHRRVARQPARVCTPLTFLQEGACGAESAWFISAGGSNTDILKAFAASVNAEPRVMGALCGNPSSPLARAAEACSYCDLALFDLPAGKDGFLATNSLLAFCVLLMRAYETLLSGETQVFNPSTMLRNAVGPGANAIADEFSRIERVLERQTLIVLHGAVTQAAACDVESRFTEAALGWVQVADYRNFAHGRHHWLAKNAEQSAVVAFIGPEERDLASKTLTILPKSVPALQIALSGDWKQAALEAVAISQRLAQWKGELRGIDPGRPGVPHFGHQIYELEYDSHKTRGCSGSVDASTRAILERKTGQTVERLSALGVMEEWLRDLNAYRSKLRNANFAAVVFDYDGTLVGPKKRTEPPEFGVARELARLVGTGVTVGIATGRGVSVRDALRRVLPKEHWGNVHIGYYNGAEIAVLSDDSAPHREGTMCEELKVVARELHAHRELVILAKQTERPHQITLEPRKAVAENALWALANDVVRTIGIPGVRVVRSSHSADVLAPGVSKRNVVERVWSLAGQSLAEPICIGDRGRWPGNDFELLSGRHSLSVDEVSGAADRCWNLASPTTRGVETAKEYLVRLQPHESGRGVAFIID